MFVTGILLVASMALMAPLLQGVMGYPILDAGLLLGTRGLGMASPCWWRALMSRVDGRILLFAGLMCCVVSLYYSIDFTPDTPCAPSPGSASCRGQGSASCSCR